MTLFIDGKAEDRQVLSWDDKRGEFNRLVSLPTGANLVVARWQITESEIAIRP
jgi:hypothetical protein